MGTDREERIRTRAYEIWERQGSPDGQHHEHWEQAARDIETESEAGQDAAGGIRVTVDDDPTRRSSSSGGTARGSEPQAGHSSGTGLPGAGAGSAAPAGGATTPRR